MMRMVMVTTTLTTMVTSSMMLFAKPYPIATYTFSPTFKTCYDIEYFDSVKRPSYFHLFIVEFFAVVWQFGRCILLHLVMIQSIQRLKSNISKPFCDIPAWFSSAWLVHDGAAISELRQWKGLLEFWNELLEPAAFEGKWDGKFEWQLEPSKKIMNYSDLAYIF